MRQRIRISLAIAALIAGSVIARVELGPGPESDPPAATLAPSAGSRPAAPAEAEGRAGEGTAGAAAGAADGGTEGAPEGISAATADHLAAEGAGAPSPVEESARAGAFPAGAGSTGGPILAGGVVSVDGLPLADARVTADRLCPTAEAGESLSTLAVATDTAGSFELRLPAAGETWSLVARHPAGSAVRLVVETVAEDRRGVVIALLPGASLAGVVTEAEVAGRARPVAGAMVRVTPEAGISIDPVLVLRTDDDGRFAAAGLAPGLHRVAVNAPGRAEWRRSVSVGPEGHELQVELSAGSALAGRIVAAGGRRIADARVVATASRGTRRSAISDLCGEFAFDLLEGEVVELSASAEGFADRTVRVPLPAEEPVVIELADAAECAGMVIAAESGAPLSQVRVEAWPAGEALAEGAAPLRTLTDAEGLFRFGLDPRIAWRLRAEAEGFEPTVQSVESGRFHRLALLSGSELELRLIDDAGEAVVHAIVRLESRDGETLASAPTGAEGRVRFLAVPAEASRLRITHDRTLAAVIPRAGLRSGREETLELRRAGTVRGVLLHSAEIAGDLTLAGGERVLQTWPDATGSFEFAGLAPGTYQLRYRPRRDLPWLEQVLSLRGGETFDATVDARGSW